MKSKLEQHHALLLKAKGVKNADAKAYRSLYERGHIRKDGTLTPAGEQAQAKLP